MALVKCPYCNHEVSDKALKCVHCGYVLFEEKRRKKYCSECGKELDIEATECSYCGFPIEQQNDYKSKPETKPNNELKHNRSQKASGKNKSLKIVLLILGIIIILAIIAFLALGASVSSEIKETKANITPYLDYIGTYVPDDEYLDIDDALYEKRDEVFFMGMKGYVQFYTEDNYVYKCTWDSDEEFREEDYQKIADELYVYFGEEPTYDTSSYHTGDTYFYYWTDPNNNFSVTCSRDFFGYDSPGRLEISWEAEGDVLESIKEVPEIDSETIDETDNERAEASDYDEFKHAMDAFLLEIPNCYLELDYTDEDNSYSINMDDEIVGIFGVKIDSWDAVALIDPNKEDAELYHEQVSIALIMACDSDISYEQAKEIFEEASEEDSASVSAGIWCFEGMDSGMLAFGVDITWLD